MTPRNENPAAQQSAATVELAEQLAAASSSFRTTAVQLCDCVTAHDDTILARLAWSLLAEPGDRIAGKLCAHLGPLAALNSVLTVPNMCVTGNTTPKLTAVMPTLQQINVQPRSYQAALARWHTRLQQQSLLELLENCFHSAAQTQTRLLTPECHSWPAKLQDLGESMPHTLWYRGNLQNPRLHTPQLAVVGARSSSEYGIAVTEHFTARALAAGCTIISGAAFGIDAVAHRTALQQQGHTVAVLAGGIAQPYPRSHLPLLTEIVAAAGAVVTEMPPDAAPTRWRFLQRNRIIAALSDAVLVTEASTRSGSINTAGHAAQLGRALGAVPGNITSYGSQGCHKLILEYGAEMICDTAQLQTMLGISHQVAATPERDKSTHLRVLDALPRHGSRQLGQIAAKAGISYTECENALAELELLGQVEQTQHGAAQAWKIAATSAKM